MILLFELVTCLAIVPMLIQPQEPTKSSRKTFDAKSFFKKNDKMPHQNKMNRLKNERSKSKK